MWDGLLAGLRALAPEPTARARWRPAAATLPRLPATQLPAAGSRCWPVPIAAAVRGAYGSAGASRSAGTPGGGPAARQHPAGREIPGWHRRSRCAAPVTATSLQATRASLAVAPGDRRASSVAAAAARGLLDALRGRASATARQAALLRVPRAALAATATPTSVITSGRAPAVNRQ